MQFVRASWSYGPLASSEDDIDGGGAGCSSKFTVRYFATMFECAVPRA